MLYRNFGTGEADGGVLNLWSLGDEVIQGKMGRMGRSGLEGVSTEASGDRFKTCGVASTPLCGGKDYDLSCLNFASAKTTKSGNIGCSCIMPRTISTEGNKSSLCGFKRRSQSWWAVGREGARAVLGHLKKQG